MNNRGDLELAKQLQAEFRGEAPSKKRRGGRSRYCDTLVLWKSSAHINSCFHSVAKMNT